MMNLKKISEKLLKIGELLSDKTHNENFILVIIGQKRSGMSFTGLHIAETIERTLNEKKIHQFQKSFYRRNEN